MMCPLKEDCPHDLRPRYPHSDVNLKVPMGLNCPYAHHISELKFENEIKERIKLKLKQLTSKKDKDPVIKPFVPTGRLTSCVGCGNGGRNKGVCNFCRYNLKNKERLKHDKIAAKQENVKILERINYQSKKPEDWDKDYITKFGLLKRSNVLFNFRRFTDAYHVIGKAKKLVIEENKLNEEKYVSIDEKWRKTLKITVKMPRELLHMPEINQNVLEDFSVGSVDISTALVFVEKMRKDTNFTVANRHTFLNNQILLFDRVVEKKIQEYDLDIVTIKSKIRELENWDKNKEKLINDPDPIKQHQFGYYTRKYRSEMCSSVAKDGKCKEGYTHCKYAHFPVQLNLVSTQKEKTMLIATQRNIRKKIKKSRPLIPWRPGRQGFIERARGRGRVRPPKKLKHQVTSKFLENVGSSERRTKSEKKLRSKSKDIRKVKLFHEI